MLQTLGYLYLNVFDPGAMVAVSVVSGILILINPKISKRVFFFLAAYLAAAALVLIVLTYLAFRAGDFTALYFRGDVGYFNVILFRSLMNFLTVALFAYLMIVLVRALAKRRPFFGEDDEWRMGSAMLIISSGFLGNALFFRLAFLPFLYQELFLLLLFISSGFVGAAVLSIYRKGKGRINIVPIVLGLAIAVSVFSSKIAGYLSKFKI